jgi:hypothetical protein
MLQCLHMPSVMAVLKAHTELQELSLYGNNIGSRGAHAVWDTAVQLPSLRDVCVMGNSCVELWLKVAAPRLRAAQHAATAVPSANSVGLSMKHAHDGD